MSIPMASPADVIEAVNTRQAFDACVRREDVLPILTEATGRKYAASAMKQKRGIHARARNGVRIVVTWLWDMAYVFVFTPGQA